MTLKRSYDTRAYFLILFLGIQICFCPGWLLGSIAFPLTSAIEEVVRSCKSAELIFFPYCLDPVLFSFFHSDFMDNLILLLIAAMTGFAMGAKRDLIWKICLKVFFYVLVSYIVFYLSWCFLAKTAPTFPPELSIHDWMELGRGK